MPLFNVMFTLTFIPVQKGKKKKTAQRDAWAIWLWLGPWRNHYPHDPQLLIPSLTPPSVSHFSHSLDKFIYMKDHSYWQGGLQVNDNLTNGFMRYYCLSATQSKGCGKCIINKSAPFPWLKGSTCFNYPAVIWTRSALRSVTQIFHRRASEINSAAALCIQRAARGQGETQSDSLFVFPSVWVSP